MAKRVSRLEKKRILELETSGIAIEDVYGSKKASSLFLCLSKAMIIFLVCVGTVTGFCDAFSLNYDKTVIVLFTLAASVLISLLYLNKKIFYAGYIAFLVLFTVELLRYYLYANSGFQAITNHIREEYGEFFNMSVVRTAEESITNRKLTITIALVFIIAFLVIMYNITVSRYMNFAETFGISFILLQVPLYIGLKPPLISIILIMTGCICTGMLQKGAFNRVTIPGKNAPDYIRDRLFKKTYYTTRGDYKGILMVLALSAVFSFVICIFSLPAYTRDIGETPEDSAKASFDDTVKILVQNGLYGLFNSYDSINGLNRGRLGGVSAVNPDFRTDIVVSFVPSDNETVYLPGYKGVSYTGKNWLNRVNIADYPELKLGNDGYIDSAAIDLMDERLMDSVLKKSVRAKAQISYIDRSFGMYVYPYITFSNDVSNAEEQLYEPEEPEQERVLETKELYYYPLSDAEYVNPEEEGFYELYSGSASINVKNDYVSGDTKKSLDYYDYINDICLKVPKELDTYLEQFCRDHGYFGFGSSRGYKPSVSLEGMEGDETEIIEKYTDELNSYRLNLCKALEDMFLAEYPYTLSPGKTPNNEDYVRYFLESQKRGLCSHFASAGVMLLRHMKVPARYVEGYCIPYSLMSEEATKTNADGSSWFSGENAFNENKTVYSVPVSDYYAHAWIEIYLEGRGWVPYEVTPPSFEAAPAGQQLTGLGRFFSQLLNVDLGFGGDSPVSDVSVSDDDTTLLIEEDEQDKDLAVFMYPLLLVTGVVVVFWMLFLLIRKIIREIRFSRYIREGRFGPVVYARYNEFVKRLKRKKIITSQNPLPLEVCEVLTEYSLAKDQEHNGPGDNTDDVRYKESYEIKYSENLKLFRYIERVLYSDGKSDINEYNDFYTKLKNSV